VPTELATWTEPKLFTTEGFSSYRSHRLNWDYKVIGNWRGCNWWE